MTTDPPAAARAVPLLRVRGLTFSHPPASGVFDVSLDLFPGEIVAVIGPSGGGKSSLIRLLAGLTRADGGTVALEGESIESLDLRHYRRRVAMLFQQPHMATGTVADNLYLPARLHGEVEGRADVRQISRARHQPASGPDDPSDVNGDGMITQTDVLACIPLCTRLGCATE